MSEILLETGTGEVEIIEFIVHQQSYAINVLKVRGIIEIEDIVPIPQAPAEIIGMMNIRGEMDVVIDLKKVLFNEKTQNYRGKLGLLCEFNGTVVVFLVEEVKGITKVTWEEIKQMNQVRKDTPMIGSILSEKGIIILLDFEAITLAANLGEGYQKQSILINENIHKERNVKIVFVEDSRAIREMVKCSLLEVGYKKVKVFSNGKDAYEYISDLKRQLGKAFTREVDILITDIEMPILDGYTLTRKIKEDEILKILPVIIFSSLITEELKHKGESVGADVQISKPSIKELVEVVDKTINNMLQGGKYAK